MDSTGSSGRTSPDEFLDRLRELVSKNVDGNTQLLVRFSDFLKEASGVASAGSIGKTDAEELLSKWLDFNLAIYSVVNTQGLALLNGLLTAAQTTLLPHSTAVPKASGTVTQPIELHLSGRHGERATTSFVIENHFSQPLTITFESGMLTPPIGPTLPASVVNFEPTTLMIGPHGQGIARVAVTITADFVVGQTYKAKIRPLGFGATEFGLSLTILPPGEATDVSYLSSSQVGPSPKTTERSSVGG
jgi:hypothetical protein